MLYQNFLLQVIFKGQKLLILVIICLLGNLFLGGCQKQNMPRKSVTIGLISDFGSKDWYTSQLKASILAINGNAKILDLNHEIGAYQIEEASYVVDRATRYFPAGSIFVVVVDPGVGTERAPIALESGLGHFYVAPDNGVLSEVVRKEGIRKLVRIENKAYFRSQKISNTFHGRDIFGPVASHLAKGVPLDKLGPPTDKLIRLDQSEATRGNGKVLGEVVYIDHYGNAITNIPKKLMNEQDHGKLMQIRIGNRKVSAPFVKTYGEAPKDRLCFLINSDDQLEFAVSGGSAEKSYRMKIGSKITISLN